MTRPTSDYTVQPLNYSSAKPRRDPSHWPPLSAYICAVFAAFVCAATCAKMVPGGPFISLHADVLPVLLCLAVLFFGSRSVLHGRHLAAPPSPS